MVSKYGSVLRFIVEDTVAEKMLRLLTKPRISLIYDTHLFSGYCCHRFTLEQTVDKLGYEYTEKEPTELELSENLTIAPLLSFFCRVKKTMTGNYDRLSQARSHQY